MVWGVQMATVEGAKSVSYRDLPIAVTVIGHDPPPPLHPTLIVVLSTNTAYWI